MAWQDFKLKIQRFACAVQLYYTSFLQSITISLIITLLLK